MDKKFIAKEWLKILVLLPIGFVLLTILDSNLLEIKNVLSENEAYYVILTPYIFYQAFCIIRWGFRKLKA
jgi:hypothetical protein